MRADIARVIVAISLAGWGIASCGLLTARGDDQLEWLYQGQPLESWIEQLQAKEAEQREQAVKAVGSFLDDQPKRVRKVLIGLLDDPSPAVRAAAVRGLSWNLGRPIPPGRSENIIEALTQRLLDSQESSQVRGAVARGLGNLEIEGAEALISAMGQIENVKVRNNVIEQLSGMPGDLYEQAGQMPPVRKALAKLAREQPERFQSLSNRRGLLREAVERVDEPEVRADARKLLDAADRIDEMVVERLVEEVNTKYAPVEARIAAIGQLLSYSDHEAAAGVVEALAADLESENEHLCYWAATALAAIDLTSDAGDRAVDFLVEDFVQEVRRSDGVSEPLMWKFRFATSASDRREEIFKRVIDQLDDEEKVAQVQEVRLGLLENINALTPELLISLLDYEHTPVQRQAAEELGRFGPSVAEKAAPALVKVLEDLPEDIRQARYTAGAVVEALTKIDPEAEHSPLVDPKTLIQLVRLGVETEWVVGRFREHGNFIIKELAKAVDQSPGDEKLPERAVFLESSTYTSSTSSQRFTRVLSKLGELAVPALKRLLIEHAEDDRGRMAAGALSRIEPQGTQVLTELAKHGDSAVRKAIRFQGGGVVAVPDRSRSDIPQTNETPPKLDEATAEPATRTQDVEPSTGTLIKKPQHDDPKTTEETVDELRQPKEIDSDAAAAAQHESSRRAEPRSTLDLLNDLQSSGEKALPEVRDIIERTAEQPGADDVKAVALKTIAKMGPGAAKKAEDFLRDELDSSNRLHRFWAAVAMSQTEEGTEAVLPVLIEVLKTGGRARDNSQDLRILAAEALGRIGPDAEAAIEPLLELARLRPEVRPPRRGLQTRDGNLHVEESIAPGNDPSEVYKVMEAAVAALGQIGRKPEKVVSVLNDLLDLEEEQSAGDPSYRSSHAENVSRQAADALRSFGAAAQPAAPELIQRLDEHHLRESPAGKTLLAMGDLAIPALADALDKGLGEDFDTAKSAAKLLGEMGETAAPAVPELINVVRDHGMHWAVREVAIQALGRIGEPARPAIPYLKALSEKSASPDWMEQN